MDSFDSLDSLNLSVEETTLQTLLESMDTTDAASESELDAILVNSERDPGFTSKGFCVIA
uniref:Phb1.1.42 n=1 Tax=Coprinopsis cinerea TaxID=5346 RepID=Q9UVN1_COPCI|nr:Phb1.1.42 [Coprinopsis cinerea]